MNQWREVMLFRTVKRSGILFLALIVMMAVPAGCRVPNEKLDIRLVLEAQSYKDGKAVTKEELEITSQIIEKRLKNLGVSKSLVMQDYTGNRIIVNMADVPDPEKVAEILKTTAKLTFRELKESKGVGEIDDVILMDGRYLKDARINQDRSRNNLEYVVEFELNAEGSKLFGDITTKYAGKEIAIYLDDEFLQAPVVSSPILGGKVVITGYESVQEAIEMVTLLKSGPLPVRMEIVELSS
jgi:preprotein translocase subunit SecD